MNILISTTTNWNCGDDFIRYGVKNILKHIFPFEPNYIHYDRNPNNMVNWPDDQRMKSFSRGTFMNNPIDWSIVDLVVLAGSPEFLHHPLAPIYEGLVDHPEIPLWVIGVGYSEPEFVLPLTDEEKDVLRRESTLLIVRQKSLSIRLFEVLGLQKRIYVAPCPALFCFESFPEKTRDLLTPTQIAHSLEELTPDSYFNSEPYETLQYIGSHKEVISHRLHGTIAAISSGAKAKLINDSFRCQEAIKLFKEVIESDPATITAFKIRTLNNYIEIIKPYYDKSFTA